MNPLVCLLIVAIPGDAPIAPRYPADVEVFHCDFAEAKWDKNFDHWPDGWVRERGRGFPGYLSVKLEPGSAPGGGAVLAMELDGGAIAVYAPPIDISRDYAYVAEVLVKTDRLVHDRAFLSATLLDEGRHKVHTLHSEKVRDSRGWRKIRLGPFAAEAKGTRFAVVGLHLEPQGKADLTGAVQFADVWMGRLPRMSATLNSPTHLFSDPGEIEVFCDVSGFTDRERAVRFELSNEMGGSILSTAQALSIAPAASETVLGAAAPDDRGPPLRGTAVWKPPVPGPGFYRVRAELSGPQGQVQARQMALAVLGPVPGGDGGEFGWSLPNGAGPLELATLAQVIRQAGINWVKYPVWFGTKTPASDIEPLIVFGERLNARGIELVGMLNHPPQELSNRFPGPGPLAADVFSAGPELWYPALEPVLMRLATRVRWWQLGADDDRSFVGYPDLAGKVGQIKEQLDRVGQDVRVGFGWDWMHQLPTARGGKTPWRFLALSSDPPLTPEEMAFYLTGTAPASAQRWVSLEPLRRDDYPVQVRAVDLVRRMMAAKIHRAEGVFLTDPFDPQTGVMNPDGTVDELFLPWRTAALLLRGTEHLGSIRLPGGSPNHVFAHGDEAVMVVWNDRPAREVLYLGQNVRQIDLWGRAKTLPAQRHEQIVEAGPTPTFVTGLSRAVAQWRKDFAFDHVRIPSIFGQSHANSFQLTNRFPRGVSGTAELVVPEIWSAEPRRVSFRLAAGETQSFPFQVVLPYHAANGRHPIRIDFELLADRSYHFSVYRHMDLGLGDVYIEIGTRLNDKGEAEIEQRFINETDHRVSFDCQLYVPDRKRLKTQVLGLGTGRDVQVYRLPQGDQLLGSTVWLRAVEIGGPRILNYRFVVKK